MYTQEYWQFVLIACCLMAACLICMGLVGILVSKLHIDWRLRVGAAILLLSPLLALPAVEILWMLALQTFLVALQVRLLDRLFLGKIAASANTATTRKTKRFSIATLLFVTALVAALVVMLKRTPALNLQGWTSIVLIAVAASVCVSIAWLAGKLRWRWWAKWPLAIGSACLVAVPTVLFDWLLPALTAQSSGWPPDEFFLGLTGSTFPAGAPTFGWLLIAVAILLYSSVVLHLARRLQAAGRGAYLIAAIPILPLVALLGWTYIELLPPRKVLPAKDAAHLAWERVIELSHQIDASNFDTALSPYGGWETAPIQPLKASLLPIEGQIEDLMDELRHPIRMMSEHRSNDFSEVNGLPSAARALLALGRTRLLAREPDKAMEAFRLVARLGVKARRGGVMIDELVGKAVTAGCFDQLYHSRHVVSNEVRTMTCAELTQLLDELEPLADFIERDRTWTKAQGWLYCLQVVIDEWLGTNAVVGTGERYHTFRLEELAHLRLLILELALSSYALEHDGYPETLEALVPAYLPDLPDDPFARSGQGMKYVVSDLDYRLYSLGWNRVDDGGMPNPSDPASGMVDKSAGDITFQQSVGN